MLLTETKIKAAKSAATPYKLFDGQGLFLLIHPNGSKYWRCNYRFAGKSKTEAFGVYPLITLAQARDKRHELRKAVAEGIDPAAERQEKKLEASGHMLFETVARAWHKSNQKWNPDHSVKVLRSLETHVFPSLGVRDIRDLKTQSLLAPVKAVANAGHLELASRLQQRIAGIMRYAVQHGMIEVNPAADLAGVVPTRKANHRASLDFERLPELLARIGAYEGRPLTRLAVELSLLVFIRSSELRFARWSEIDLERKIWTIPAEREPIDGVKFSERGAKMRTPHLVPLSDQAITVLKLVYFFTGKHDLVFAGDHNPKRPMSENTVNHALRKMGYDTQKDVCGHGFRSMACSALIESGQWSKDAVERQMSHQERNSVRAAYIHKAAHLDERRLMMQWWADYLDANRKGFVSPYEFGHAQK